MNSRLRWVLKKLSRSGIAIGTLAIGGLTGLNKSEREQSIRVLTYHRFGNIPRDPFCMSLGNFQSQIAYLANKKIAISLTEFEDILYYGLPIRPGAVLVTIDDGCCSTFERALPILRDYEVPAVAFVTPSLIRDISSGDLSIFRGHSVVEDYMSWRELEQLVGARVSIGSHSWTHHSLGRMSPSQVEEEVNCSRDILEQRLGIPIKAFAYPYGTRADFNNTTRRILKEAGYRFAFTSQHGSIRKGDDPLCLPRIKVESGEGLWLFKLLLRGGLDAWSWVDDILWKLQATEHEP